MIYFRLFILSGLLLSQAINIYAGPISDAIDNDDKNALIKLSDSGATEDGMTPLFLATLTGSTDLVQALLATNAGKASVNATMTSPDYSGWTVLHAAANNDDLKTLQTLWQAGARPQPGASESVESLIGDDSVKKEYMNLAKGVESKI